MSPFCFSVDVYYEDTDAGGVVYHANYLKFLERARSKWLIKIGLQQSILLRENIAFAVSSLSAKYHKPAYFEDNLQIYSTISSCKHCSLVYQQEIKRKKELLLTAEVVIVCISTKNFRPQRIPEKIKNFYFHKS